MNASTRPTSVSERDLDRLIDRSRRATGARLPAGFARGRHHVLAGLIQGGRGGEVRLKLYVSMVLLAGSTHERKGERHTIRDVSGPTWARILALPDPSGLGARRIADAQNALADRQVIDVQRRPGEPPITTLRSATGDGSAFAEPGTPYIRIPLGLWANRWIWALSGKELAVVIALIDLCHGKGRDGTGARQALSSADPHRYGMSEDTWRTASVNLEKAGLIKTALDVVRVDLQSPRIRKVYELVESGLALPAPVIVL